MNHFIVQDNWWVAKAYLSLARYYILQGNLEQAERHIQLCEEYADEYFTSNLSVAIHKQAVESIISYAKYNRFYQKEWALLGNQLDELLSEHTPAQEWDASDDFVKERG